MSDFIETPPAKVKRTGKETPKPAPGRIDSHRERLKRDVTEHKAEIAKLKQEIKRQKLLIKKAKLTYKISKMKGIK